MNAGQPRVVENREAGRAEVQVPAWARLVRSAHALLMRICLAPAQPPTEAFRRVCSLLNIPLLLRLRRAQGRRRILLLFVKLLKQLVQLRVASFDGNLIVIIIDIQYITPRVCSSLVDCAHGVLI